MVIFRKMALCFDGCHILGGQGEVEQVEVLLHPLFVNRLGDDDNIALHQETQSRLGCGLAVLCTDGGQYGVGEHLLAALCKGTPGLDLTTVLLQILFCQLLLLEHVSLHLVHGRLDLFS